MMLAGESAKQNPVPVLAITVELNGLKQRRFWVNGLQPLRHTQMEPRRRFRRMPEPNSGARCNRACGLVRFLDRKIAARLPTLYP